MFYVHCTNTIIITTVMIIQNATDYSDAVMNKTLQGHFTISTSLPQTR